MFLFRPWRCRVFVACLAVHRLFKNIFWIRGTLGSRQSRRGRVLCSVHGKMKTMRIFGSQLRRHVPSTEMRVYRLSDTRENVTNPSISQSWCATGAISKFLPWRSSSAEVCFSLCRCVCVLLCLFVCSFFRSAWVFACSWSTVEASFAAARPPLLEAGVPPFTTCQNFSLSCLLLC